LFDVNGECLVKLENKGPKHQILSDKIEDF